MTTSSVAVSEGSGKNLATNSITEDAKTKEVSRVTLNTSAGADILGTAGTANANVISVQGIASGTVLPVSDNSSSLTVDAPVGTPIAARLSDGSAFIAALPITDNSGSLTVDNSGTFAVQAAQSGTWNVTNVSGTISLPTGAATAAKQPALGTAGSPSVDVLTIQGNASSTAVPVSVASRGYASAVTLTRTADTNAYAANDVLGAATGSTAALTFASIAPAAGEIMITSASLEIDASAVISGETSYRLYLYNVTPPSALGDNTAWDLPSGDRASFLGYIDLGTPVDLGSTLYVQTDSINKQITTLGTSIFGYLVTIGTYTPTSARVHKITLHAAA